MNQRQLASQDAARNVLTHFDAHRAAWEANEPVADSVEALRSTTRQIQLSALVQADSTTGNTTAKNIALDLAADKAYRLSRRICAWARKKDRDDVLGAIDFSLSALSQGAEDDALLRQRLVLQYASELRTDLVAYGVTEEVISEAEQAVGAFEALKEDRNEKRQHRIYSTGYLDELFEQADKQLAILDDEVEGLIDNKEFIDTYFIARRKTDRRATRASGSAETSPASA